MMMKNKGSLAALALAAALVLSGCGGSGAASSQETEESAGVAVQVETVSADTIATETTVSGKISADNEAVITVASAAKCTAVYARAGDTVAAGDKLCTLDLGSTLASYNAAKISYDSAVQSYQEQKAVLDAQVALCEKNVSDLKALYAIGAASQMEIDSAELQLKSTRATRNSTLAQLEAGVQNAKSGVEQLNVVMENVDSQGNVIAPIAGTVVSMSAEEGSFVSNTMPVAVIDGAGQMKVTVSVSETLVPKLNAGDMATVTVSAAGKTFEAAIRSVERAANMQTKLYAVTLTVPAEVEGLTNGMFADVTFRTDASENAVVVPTEAILTNGDIQYVYVVEDDVAHYTEITTGLTGSGVTEITSGLTAGQQLVTVGQSYLSDGAAVRIVAGQTGEENG